MQKFSVANLKSGMIVGRNIYSNDGLLLLNAGTDLTESFIERLKRIGIGSIYIKDAYLDNIEIPEIIQEETRQMAISVVRKSFQEFKASARINIEQFSQTANWIVDEVMKNQQAMVHLTDIRTHDNYTFSHSVNVCMLSTITGLQMGYGTNQLKTLALGALLHDIGKAFVPLEILTKPSRLTAEEMSVMQTHTEMGFELLRKETNHVPLLAAHVAFQHHEKNNGRGYPRGLDGDSIHEYAKITSIADVYDAVTADRPYRSRMPAHEAYELVAALADTQFDSAILTTFLSNVAIYPIGCFVAINTGEIGIVINVLPKLPTRPIIKVITDPDSNRLAQPYELDLTKHLTLFISTVLTETDICDMKLV